MKVLKKLILNDNITNPCDTGFKFIKRDNTGYCVKGCFRGTDEDDRNPFKCKRLGTLWGGTGQSTKELCEQKRSNLHWYTGCVEHGSLWYARCPCGHYHTNYAVEHCYRDVECCGKDEGYKTDGEWCKSPCYNIDTGQACPEF